MAKKRMARPKTGRKTYPHSLALTMEQIEFLRKFPNSSDFIRKLLDEIIASWENIEDKFPILVAKDEVEALEREIKKLDGAGRAYRMSHYDELYDEKNAERRTPQAEFIKQVASAYDEKEDALRAKVEEIKKKYQGS